jgi:hypothetical protein
MYFDVHVYAAQFESLAGR